MTRILEGSCPFTVKWNQKYLTLIQISRLKKTEGKEGPTHNTWSPQQLDKKCLCLVEFHKIVSYLFRWENAQGSSIFPDGNAHLSQQGLSGKNKDRIGTLRPEWQLLHQSNVDWKIKHTKQKQSSVLKVGNMYVKESAYPIMKSIIFKRNSTLKINYVPMLGKVIFTQMKTLSHLTLEVDNNSKIICLLI